MWKYDPTSGGWRFLAEPTRPRTFEPQAGDIPLQHQRLNIPPDRPAFQKLRISERTGASIIRTSSFRFRVPGCPEGTFGAKSGAAKWLETCVVSVVIGQKNRCFLRISGRANNKDACFQPFSRAGKRNSCASVRVYHPRPLRRRGNYLHSGSGICPLDRPTAK